MVFKWSSSFPLIDRIVSLVPSTKESLDDSTCISLITYLSVLDWSLALSISPTNATFIWSTREVIVDTCAWVCSLISSATRCASLHKVSSLNWMKEVVSGLFCCCLWGSGELYVVGSWMFSWGSCLLGSLIYSPDLIHYPFFL